MGELAFLTLGSTAAGMLLWNQAVLAGGTARISLLLYLEPAVSVLGAVAFLGEHVTLAVIAGGLLITAGVAAAITIRSPHHPGARRTAVHHLRALAAAALLDGNRSGEAGLGSSFWPTVAEDDKADPRDRTFAATRQRPAPSSSAMPGAWAWPLQMPAAFRAEPASGVWTAGLSTFRRGFCGARRGSGTVGPARR